MTSDLFDNEPYRGHAPFSDHDTSREAAERINPGRMVMRMKVLTEIKRGPLACHEIEVRLKMPHTTASARIRELFLKGLIEHNGQYRYTPASRRAKVWRAIE
jgi:Fic family protein